MPDELLVTEAAAMLGASGDVVTWAYDVEACLYVRLARIYFHPHTGNVGWIEADVDRLCAFVCTNGCLCVVVAQRMFVDCSHLRITFRR